MTLVKLSTKESAEVPGSDIKTGEDYWKARAHLNFSRRNAQEARQKKLEIVNKLAEFYQKHGYKVVGAQRCDGHQGGGNYCNEVLDAVIKALDGAITEDWVRHNIDQKYVQFQQPSYDFSKPRVTTPTKKAIDYLKDDKKKE